MLGRQNEDSGAIIHWHGMASMETLLMLRTSQASADSSANADWVGGGDGEHLTTLAREGDGGGDHAGGLDGDKYLSARARIVAVVALTMARGTWLRLRVTTGRADIRARAGVRR